MNKILELKQQRLAVSEKLADLVKAGFTTNEQRTRYDNLILEAEDIGDQIRSLQSENLNDELSQRNPPPSGPIAGQPMESRIARAGQGAWNWITQRMEHRSDPALDRFLRNGDKSKLIESRDMGIGSPTASVPTSVLVPQAFQNEMEVALKFYGQILDIARDVPTANGAPMPWPTTDDTSVSAEIIGEGQPVSAADVSVGNIVFQAYKYSTKLVKVSLELLQDSAFPLQTYLAEQFSIRLARRLTEDFTNGSGTAEPRGFMIDAVLGATAVGANANSGDSGQTAQNSIGTTDLLALIHSVDPYYRQNGTFVLHDQTLQALAAQLDKFGRPLYLPNPQTGKLDQLFGYPVRIDNSMDTLAEDSPTYEPKTVAFGDFSKYVVRRVKDLAVLRLVERYAEFGQVGFIGFARYDGKLLDAGTHPIKYLQNPS